MVSRCREDPARARPGSSNIEKAGGGWGKKKEGQRSSHADCHMLILSRSNLKEKRENLIG